MLFIPWMKESFVVRTHSQLPAAISNHRGGPMERFLPIVHSTGQHSLIIYLVLVDAESTFTRHVPNSHRERPNNNHNR